MGSPENELGRDFDETLHEVKLTREFFIGVFPVTQRQWELVTGNNPSKFTNAGPEAPVERVSYGDIYGPNRPWPKNADVAADSFLGRLRARTGSEEFDLPTEAQWETRAGQARRLR